MKSKLMLLLLAFSFCSFAGVDSGTGGEPEGTDQSSNSCEMYLQGVETGTGTEATGDGGGKADQDYLEKLYAQCMEESTS